jgi:hypothetical protein
MSSLRVGVADGVEDDIVSDGSRHELVQNEILEKEENSRLKVLFMTSCSNQEENQQPMPGALPSSVLVCASPPQPSQLAHTSAVGRRFTGLRSQPQRGGHRMGILIIFSEVLNHDENRIDLQLLVAA